MAIADYLRQWGQQLNQGMQGMAPALERGMQNPLTHAGLGIYMGSMEGGPGAAPGFMQGMQGFNQLKDQQTMRDLQKMQVGRLQKQDDREEAQRKAVMEMLKSNPNALPPMAQSILQATGDPSSLQGLAGFMPKQPAPMSEYQAQQLGIQQERVGMEKTRAELDRERLGLEARRVGATEASVQREAEAAQRAAKAAQQKSRGTANDLDARFAGATAELDQLSTKLKAFTEQPGFNAIYGRSGAALQQLGDKVGMVAPEAANALAMRDEIMAMGGLSRLMDLKGSGVSLGQVTEAEHKLLQQSFANLQAAQTEEAAQQRIKELVGNIDAVKQRITQAYRADRSLYEDTGGIGGSPRQITDQAEHQRLPSGTTYIAPDGSVRVKK